MSSIKIDSLTDLELEFRAQNLLVNKAHELYLWYKISIPKLNPKYRFEQKNKIGRIFFGDLKTKCRYSDANALKTDQHAYAYP